jgi:Tol biopolymer transport system component
MRLSPGMRLGSYEIQSAIGAGGMGEVFRARDLKLGRDVAIKILPLVFTSDPERLTRFEREARLLASLNHPNIGAIYGLEHTPSGPGGVAVPALVLELIDGETLADRLSRGPIPVPEALHIARQIADALDTAHERGIIHRDLKPANIKITSDGIVKVLDFGLAKTLGPDPEGSAEIDLSKSPTVTISGTREGVILGTAAYMSPEQARGKPLDKRTDIWAFGCVVYETLTGRLAFNGETASDLIAAILERTPDMSALPAATPATVQRLIRRCLEKDAKRRLRDIADARLEIDEAIAPPASPERSVPAIDARTPAGALALWRFAAIALAIALAGTIGWFVSRQPAESSAPRFDRVIRLVSTAAHEFGPAISPDGKWVAYLSNARGPTDVWVKFIAGGDPANLTASADIQVQSQDSIGGLEVSPDGTQISVQVQAQAQQGLGASWIIAAPLGGVPRRVTAQGFSGLRWSPDGKHIAYVRTGGSLGDALMVADADGQNEREVVKREGAHHVHWPRWSADSRYIYFNRGFQNFNTEPTEVHRVLASGGAVEPVITSARRAGFPFPSPDGRGLYYAANPDSVDLGIWWRDLRTGRDYRITSGVAEYTQPTVSADGRRLVGTVMEVRQSLERLAVTFDRPVALEPLTDGFSGDIDPVVAPNGARLVFSSSRTGNRTLWAARPDLTQLTPLTTGVVLDERPAYSPDGQQIAFVSDRNGHRGIWTVSADGGTPRLIAAVNVVDAISWSPDGRRLVYSAPVGDAPGLMILTVATGESTRLPTPSAATQPAWSMNDVIAYIEPRGGAIGAFVAFVRPDGQPAYDTSRFPTTQAFGNGFLSWSKDGKRLAAVSLPGAFPGSIWIVEPEGPAPFRKLLDLPSGVFLRGIAWANDGASMIVGRVRSSGDIFLAERQSP